LIELSLLVALSQPRIKLRRVAGQYTASLVKARSGQVDARAPWVQAVASPSPSLGWPWSGSRSVLTRACLSHLIEADQGLPPHGATPPPPAGGREGVCGGGGCSTRADRRLCKLARWPVSWLPPQQPHGQDVHSMGVGSAFKCHLLNNLLLSFHVCWSRLIV